MNNLGRLLREAREELGRHLEREVGAEEIAQLLRDRGVPMERRTYSNLETGRTKTIKPEIANELAGILPVSVVQIVAAQGFRLDFDGLEDEEEVEILRAYREASSPQRLAVRGALLLPVRPLPGELGRSLRRLAATDRPDRQGSQE